MPMLPIVIPTVGESVSSGVIGKWLKSDGAIVKADDVVMELETDKVTMEVRAPSNGRLKHLAKEGDTVNVGATVAQVDDSAAGESSPTPAGSSAGAGASAAAPGVASGSGQAGAPASTAAASSASVSRAPTSGASSTAHDDHADSNGVRATPLARKLAAERGLDLSKVPATGAGNRVREQDVLSFLDRADGAANTQRAASAPAASAPSATPARVAGVSGAGHARTGDAGRKIVRERMTPLRQRIASRLVEAQHTAAMLTTFNECDMTGVMELRKQYKEEFEKKHSIGLGFMSFFVRAAVQGLRAFPLVNSFIVEDDEGKPAIEKHDYCDVAVAVSTPKGLVVPVLRDCQSLSMAGVELGIKDLATRARDGKLTLEEMQGGTFTITNGGIYGSLMSTPILNPPQSAILGMHAIKNRAVEHPAGSGQVAIRPMMYLALSYDHRIIDGAEAVQFLVKIKQCIEDPHRLLLDL
ncbi:MAG: 2-oxoglutarate dehydrogenase complex dihydrolipoyllysine-residue succinyltransferase [Planctomycetota bacterium]|nr:2-oxoglutarate dehydrogenase complex dihydrolipoyllysine-residue succinyltransferase [Planctomycetota bacterium]